MPKDSVQPNFSLTEPDDDAPIIFCADISESDHRILLRPFWASSGAVCIFGGVLWFSSFRLLRSLNLMRPEVFGSLVLVLILGLLRWHLVRKRLWRRLYAQDLSTTEVAAAQFIVIGDPSTWDWPAEIQLSNFEDREFPALLSRILKKWPYLFLALPFYVMIIVNELLKGDVLTCCLVAIVTPIIFATLLDPVRYVIVPGRLNIRKATRLGRSDELEESIPITGNKCVADFVDGVVYLVDGDKTKTIPLLGIKEKQAFVYYLMMASRLHRQEH